MAVHEPRLGCGAAIIVEGRILLLKRLTNPEAGCWGLPGGKVDLFETAAAATQREIREELGIEIVVDDLLCVVDQIDKENASHWFAPVYLATSYVGEPVIVEPEKHGGLGWFPLGAVPEELTWAAIVALRSWRKRQAIA